ncbi:unnamed protein product, partial [Owenia fusiformis]
ETGDGMEEIKILQKLPVHVNLVKFHDFFFVKKSFWLVMEFCDGGDLQKHFKKLEGKIDVAVKVDFMRQLASGVKHLHDCRLVHRDLKPANALISLATGQTVLKLTDFGISKLAEGKANSMQTYMMSTSLGTPCFMAPEIFKQEKYTSSVDVFSLGLIYSGMLDSEKNKGEILPLPAGPMMMPMPIGMLLAQ